MSRARVHVSGPSPAQQAIIFGGPAGSAPLPSPAPAPSPDITWTPAASRVAWGDGIGQQEGDLAYFLAHADFSTVDSLDFASPGDTISAFSGVLALPELQSFEADNGDSLTSDNINQILSDLVTNGLFDGTITIDTQEPPAPPTDGGLAALSILTARGWGCTTD